MTMDQAIRLRISNLIYAWEVGQNQIMFKEIACTCKQYLSSFCKYNSKDHHKKTFHCLVLRGKLYTVARCILELNNGGLMQPSDTCNKTGTYILGVLR